MSHLSYNLPIIPAEDDYDLPVSYDLRKFGRVTPIRNQNPWGTCWAFGSLASVESNYLTRSLKGELDGSLGDSETLDLSELFIWHGSAIITPTRAGSFIQSRLQLKT